MSECPSHELWPQLAAGDLPEREAQQLRAHVGGCSACSERLTASQGLLAALAQPAAQPDERRVQALMRAADAPPRRLAAPLALAAGLAAAAALVPLWVVSVQRGEGFTARGGGEASWRQRVRAEIRPLGAAARPVGAGASLAARAPLTVWYRNLETRLDLQLLAFVVDGAGEVHWLSPAWAAGAPAPAPGHLPRAEGDALMPDAFVADGAAPGSGTLVTVISSAPLSLQPIELAPPDVRRDPVVLFPGAVVWSVPVHLEEAP
jgi:hypothetical protein